MIFFSLHFIHEFMILYEFYMNCNVKSLTQLDRTLLGTPEFKIFHEFMPDIMNFGHFSWKRSFCKSYLKIIVKNIVNLWKFSANYCEFLYTALRAAAPCLMGPFHAAAAQSHLLYCQPVCSAESQCP